MLYDMPTIMIICNVHYFYSSFHIWP